MSDVLLIKGMKMPKSCPCELVGVGYDMYCTFAYGVPSRVLEYYECCEKETRPEWCPLVEGTPHGKWSDKQVAYIGEYGDLHFGYRCSACGAILNKTNYCGACGAKMDNVLMGD